MLTCYRGDTLSLKVTSASPSGVPTDFTGASFSLIIKGSALSSGVSITNPEPGELRVVVDGSVTSTLYAGTYTVTLKVTYSDTTIQTLFSVQMQIREGGV